MTPPAKYHFRRAAGLVYGDDPGSGTLGHSLGELERLAFHAEIEIPYLEPAQHVAHGAACQKYVEILLPRHVLHGGHHLVLVGAQVVLQHEHVIAHGFNSRPSCPWVVAIHRLPESRPHHVGINLRRRNIGMPEHRLDTSQVRAPFQ